MSLASLREEARVWSQVFYSFEISVSFPGLSEGGTLCVNLAGYSIIGILWAFCYSFDFSPNLRTFLFGGLLGGFTTFSSFSLETMNLLNLGKVHSALFYIIGTNLGGIIAVFGGFFLAKYSLHMIKFL